MVTKYAVQIIDISSCNAMNTAVSNLMKVNTMFLLHSLCTCPQIQLSWNVTSKCSVVVK